MKTSKFNLRSELISYLKSNLSSEFLEEYTFIFDSDSCCVISESIISSVIINYLIIFCSLHDLGFYVSNELVGFNSVPAFKIFVRG